MKILKMLGLVAAMLVIVGRSGKGALPRQRAKDWQGIRGPLHRFDWR